MKVGKIEVHEGELDCTVNRRAYATPLFSLLFPIPSAGRSVISVAARMSDGGEGSSRKDLAVCLKHGNFNTFFGCPCNFPCKPPTGLTSMPFHRFRTGRYSRPSVAAVRLHKDWEQKRPLAAVDTPSDSLAEPQVLSSSPIRPCACVSQPSAPPSNVPSLMSWKYLPLKTIAYYRRDPAVMRNQ